MHMADALVSAPIAGVMGALSVGAMAFSVRRVTLEENTTKKIPTMGVMGAFVFAAQMLNFTIPGTGSSGHICGGLLLAAMLGPYAAFLSMAVVLILQCLIFADGGIMALGCNIWNMAFYACFVGYFAIYRPVTRVKMSRIRIMVASIVGCVISLQMGAFSVVLETLLSGVSSLSFGTFVALMQPIHLAIGAVEGVLTGLVLIFVYDVRPEIIKASDRENRLSFGKTLAILAVVAAVFAGGVSLVASSNPDGLEWSIGKTTDDNLEDAERNIPLADYTINGSDKPVGTSVAGIVGSVCVAAVCVAVCFTITKIRKRKLLEDEN